MIFDKFKQQEIDKVNQYYMNENLIANDNMYYINNIHNSTNEKVER